MNQIHTINEFGTEEINTSTCTFTPANYSIGIDSINTLPARDKLPRPVLKSREEVIAAMGNDPFWTAAVKCALQHGFWVIKEDAKA